MSRNVLWHTVHFKFRPGITEAQKSAIFDLGRTLAEECGGTEAGILRFKIERNLDMRKGIELGEIAVFTDNEALQNFRAHPAHVAYAQKCSKVADWTVVDFMAPLEF